MTRLHLNGFEESARVWQSQVLPDLWEHEAREALVCVTNDLPKIDEAIRGISPNADWQQYLVHKVRTTLASVRKGNEVAVMRDLRWVYTAESPEGAKAV